MTTENHFDPNRPPEQELDVHIADGFTLAAVGDCIISRPVAPLLDTDPAFAGVIAHLWDATVSIGNLETSIVDVRAFRGNPRTADDWALCAEPAVADDLATLGFDLMSRANNHGLDWGIEGLRETGRRIDAVGIVHAGAGERLAHARAPQYVQTPAGRVGFVSMYSLPAFDNDAALDPFGQYPGRPGVNGLRAQKVVTVPEDTFEGLRTVYRATYPDSPPPGDTEVRMFDVRWEPGDTTAMRYEVDLDDLTDILRTIRLGKQHADLMVAAIHIHDEGPDPLTPPDHLIALAHAAIDAGADVFLGHGVHRLWPVTFHRGKPIIFGLGNFFWSDIAEHTPPQHFAANRAKLRAVFGDIEPTDADLNLLMNATDFAGQAYFQSMVAMIEYVGGEPRVRLQPFDLGYGLPLTQAGLPRIPETGRAEEILTHLAAMSEPFGARVRIVDGLGWVEPNT